MFKRFRRLRINETLRGLVQETTLSKNDFIYPLFVKEGENFKKEIDSMPGVFQMSIDEIVKVTPPRHKNAIIGIGHMYKYYIFN